MGWSAMEVGVDGDGVEWIGRSGWEEWNWDLSIYICVSKHVRWRSLSTPSCCTLTTGVWSNW